MDLGLKMALEFNWFILDLDYYLFFYFRRKFSCGNKIVPTLAQPPRDPTTAPRSHTKPSSSAGTTASLPNNSTRHLSIPHHLAVSPNPSSLSPSLNSRLLADNWILDSMLSKWVSREMFFRDRSIIEDIPRLMTKYAVGRVFARMFPRIVQSMK